MRVRKAVARLLGRAQLPTHAARCVPFLMVWAITHLLDLSDAAAVRRRAGLRDAGPFRRLGGWAVDWRGERYVAAGSGACGRFRRAIA